MKLAQAHPVAVVIGLCGHGLAIVRSLGRKKVPVVAFEADRSLPGTRTSVAPIHWVPDINGDSLVDSLLHWRQSRAKEPKPVLFLTNDRMVATIGHAWKRLSPHFRLSWGESARQLLPLLSKLVLEKHCAEAGLAYPRSGVAHGFDDVRRVARQIGAPLIAKPARPLSSFKVLGSSSPDQMARFLAPYQDSFPVVLQQWIPGDENSLHFCGLYLDKGRVLARFEGRKIRSRPMGHTTLAEPCQDDQVFDYACRFFSGLNLSGPVSLEVKRDTDGKLWVIEPTVGRTDFWVGLCISNGIDFPYLEYLHQTEGSFDWPESREPVLWTNGERDPLGWLWWARRNPVRFLRSRWSFLYADKEDPAPLIAALGRLPINKARSILSRFHVANLRRKRYKLQ